MLLSVVGDPLSVGHGTDGAVPDYLDARSELAMSHGLVWVGVGRSAMLTVWVAGHSALLLRMVGHVSPESVGMRADRARSLAGGIAYFDCNPHRSLEIYQ